MKNIEYLLFVRSALQFKEDLSEIFKILHDLSDQEVIVVSSNIEGIKKKIDAINEEFVKRFSK